MMTMRLLLVAALMAPCLGDVVLNEKIVKLSFIGATLSSLAYEEDPIGDAYDHFGFYDAEPDQALIVQQSGYCFAAFRGTTLTWEDWSQNFDLGFHEICNKEPDGLETCCRTRNGFYKAYYTTYRNDLENALRDCAKSCENPDECVVLTGHSQGGAIAAVAGLVMADLNPYVITFGQPATIDAPCPMVTSERWYRYVNSKDTENVGIAYDPVPFAPGLGADSFGHMIMLGEDPTGVAYIGLDAQDSFGPFHNGVEAHSMIAPAGVPFPGYLDRLRSLMNATKTYPIRANGFAAGTLCSQGKECMSGVCEKETTFSYKRCVGIECEDDDECESGRCDSGSCIPKLGSCMPCDENSDCAGGRCSNWFVCSGPDGLMDNECTCTWDSDCASGRCELLETGTCEAKLAIGSSCNEGSDCISGFCSWSFICEDGTKASALHVPTSDELGKSGFWGIFLIIIVVVLLLYSGYRLYRRRRDGYSEVATEMTV